MEMQFLVTTPSKMRMEALNQSMKFHEFDFDLQRELEWIAEKVTIVSGPMDIQTLQQAQSFCKKHKKFKEELNNHSVVVEKSYIQWQEIAFRLFLFI